MRIPIDVTACTWGILAEARYRCQVIRQVRRARLVAKMTAETPIDDENGRIFPISSYRERHRRMRFFAQFRESSICLEAPGPLRSNLQGKRATLSPLALCRLDFLTRGCSGKWSHYWEDK